jgi:hypothetical protein
LVENMTAKHSKPPGKGGLWQVLADFLPFPAQGGPPMPSCCVRPCRAIGSGRRLAALVGTATLAAFLGSGGAANGSLSSSTFPSTASSVHAYTGLQGHQNHTFTASELSAIGQQSDIVVGLAVQLKQYGSALRAANPSVRLFVYQNGMFAQSNQGSTFPGSWYLHNAAGGKIMSKTNKNFLMNPMSTRAYGGDAGWAAYVAHQCVTKIAQAPLSNGCFLDQMSSAGNTAFVTSLPIDPQTGKLFTMPDFMHAVNLVGNATAARTPTIGNSYESGYRYYANSTNIVDQSSAGVFEAEHWLGATQPRDAETLSKWKMAVQMLIDSQAHGHGAMLNFGDMSTNLAQWQCFNVATMLLGNNGHVWLHFDSSSSTGPNSWELDTPIMNAPIGSPTETYTTTDQYFQNGVYQRSFTNGRVLVNPTGSTITVSLGATLTTIAGDSVTSISMPPYTGTVLIG